jgi:4-hydroxy-3-methylbut-2-en-1-yl diphosphate reductase
VLVKEVVAKLQALGNAEVTELHGVVESVVFQLPKNLTAAEREILIK